MALVDRVAMDGNAAKVRKYKERCSTDGMEFVLLAVDTFGGWHKVALEMRAKLGCHLAREVGKDKYDTVKHFQQRLGLIQVCKNMNMLLSRGPELPPSQISGQL